MPCAGVSTGRLWHSLHGLTFQSAESVLRMLTHDVVCRPETYQFGIGNFVVSIAPVCSGFEGIGLTWAFLAAYLLLFRKELRFPQALILIPLGTVVIWSFNVLRLVLLLLLGAFGHPEIALGRFPFPGWLAGIQYRRPGIGGHLTSVPAFRQGNTDR